MQVLTGEADIDGLEAPGLSFEEVFQRLLPLPGLNPDLQLHGLQYDISAVRSAAARTPWQNKHMQS